MNANFIVNGLTRLGIKPKSTAPEADAFKTGPLSVCIANIPCLRVALA